MENKNSINQSNMHILGTPQPRKSRIIPDLAEQLNEYYSNPKNWEKTPKSKQPTQINAPSIEGMIYVPYVNLYFAKEKSLLRKNWNETQNELVTNNLGAMPTPYQFKEFLRYLRDNPNNENTSIYNEITEVREPWREEWLNARFEKRKNGLYMISENVLENGNYKNIEQKLDNVLMKDKTPGINLDEWLNSNEKHGLPLSDITNGKLYYLYPKDKAVARFSADSGRVGLSCYSRDSSLGVRVVREALQK